MSKKLSNKANLQVLHEDNHIIIINKRVGDIVQGDITGDKPLSEVVKEYLKIKYQKPGNVYLGVVHRLDRPTSGIVIFAKTSKVLSRLNKMFVDRNIAKTYWAIVKNKPNKKDNTLTHWLRKNPKNNKSSAYNQEITKSKKAVLSYKTLKKIDHYFLIEIALETGRHHQIRCQLAKIGCPIKGDLKYGAHRSNNNGGIHLHSRHIDFIHPVNNQKIRITAPTPQDATWHACID